MPQKYQSIIHFFKQSVNVRMFHNYIDKLCTITKAYVRSRQNMENNRCLFTMILFAAPLLLGLVINLSF